MTITLNADYDVTLSTALLGYVGETNARPVSVEGLTVDGADRYVLTIDYGDGTVYEVDITGGQWTPTADILRSAQTVSCQICAKKLSGDEYILLKKSRIFRLRIGAAIGDTAIPSPSVAADALDRISAIGEQVEADVERAENAASTAMQAAENAKKSATAAGLSADTATQAASRAETAKTAAETSAAQSETARQGAENARQQAVTSQNAAKVSAAQAATSAQQTTVDKNITAGYAQTAKTNADNTATDRQAVQTLATQVTTDKATVADHAAQVAEDRTAAETAAQTAQSIADSLPDDYVTAVGKIAENTAEIANVKLSDKELTRRVDALYDIGQGITHKFETDTDTAYAKTVPTGAKLMSVKSVSGRSVIWNQMYNEFKYGGSTLNCKPIFKSHKYLLRAHYTVLEDVKAYLYFRDVLYTPTTNRQITKDLTAGSGKISWITSPLGEHSDGGEFGTFILVNNADGSRKYDTSPFSNHEIFDLTAMFGANNEPASVEEFEKMFPADYYPYNAGEIVSAGTESIIEQGKNLFDYTDKTHYGANISKVENGVIYTKGLTTTVLNVPTIAGNKYTLSFKVKSNTANQGGLRWSLQKGKNISYAHDSSLIKSEVGFAANTEYQAVVPFVADTDFVSLCTIVGMVYDVQLENGNTITNYFPFYQTEHPISETIKALPGYGWSAGTARNYVDYENKKYVQCVNSVDLGTKNWRMYKDGDYTPFFYLNAVSDIRGGTSNFLCPKYQYVKIGVTDSASGLYVLENTTVRVRDTAYTDATAFKQAMQGVMLYYELETPIVTDISNLIDDDFLRNIEVEAGGTITFKNSNGDSYRIPVPSKEEYVVKLSEIGGTT